MNFFRKILPVAVFGISLAGTLVYRKSNTPQTSAEANSFPGDSPAPRTKTSRSESTFAAVRALLRDGKIDAARDLLHQLARRIQQHFSNCSASSPACPAWRTSSARRLHVCLGISQ